MASTSTAQTVYSPARRAPGVQVATQQSFASPTESEFSEDDGPESVKNWDEDQVCEYLRSVKCGDYERLFRKNHINGENLLEMDKEVLKEIGIDKVGDRVRLFLSIKKLRTKAYANQKKRNRVREMPADLAWTDSTDVSMLCRIHSPASIASTLPRPARRDRSTPQTADPQPTRGIRASTSLPSLTLPRHRGLPRRCRATTEQVVTDRGRGTALSQHPAPRDSPCPLRTRLTRAGRYQAIPGTSRVLMVP